MIELKTLIHQYYDINNLYKTLILNRLLSYDEYLKICNFYDQISQLNFCDNFIKENLTRLKTDSYLHLLNVLIIQLNENISLHEENEIFLINFKTHAICEIESQKKEIPVKNQLTIISKYRQDFNEANKELEATAFNSSTNEEIKMKNLNYDTKRNKYIEQQKILDELYEKKMLLQKEVWGYNRNHFKEIHQFTKILTTNLSKEKTTYFNKGYIYSIYRICNDFIFEIAKEEDYQNVFNSTHKKATLKVMNGRKNYLYHLIKVLSTKVQNCDKDYWTDNILTCFNINRKAVYDKKKNDLETQVKNQLEYHSESKYKIATTFFYKLDELSKIEDIV